MQLPEKLLQSLQGIKGFDREAFEKVHTNGEQITSIRLNPSKFSISHCQLPVDYKVPWCSLGYYLSRRPSFTFDPLFHAGCYYVQEASSMFLEQALKQSIDLTRPLRILDLSAAPGGKSTHIQSLISKDSLLVSNDVIRSRARILEDNIIKWGGGNVVITSNDPAEFAQLENYFDAIVVDAPCSGSGLFRRDEGAIDHWSKNTVQLCNQRQQRILADVWPALKRNGILIYATCSYSREEDEDVVKWMTSEFAAERVKLTVEESWDIVESSGGYRFWPHKLKGEGFFIACLRKTEGEDIEVKIKVKGEVEILSKKQKEILSPWVNYIDHELVKVENDLYGVSKDLLSDLNILLGTLRTIYFGTMLGELIRDKLIPAHALAMSNLVSENVEKEELHYEEAIVYLQKKELKRESISKGWKLVTYENYPLGWINALPNRINNYYPKELRILKDFNQAERE